MPEINPWSNTTREIHRSHLESKYALLHNTAEMLRAGVHPLEVADYLDTIKERVLADL